MSVTLGLVANVYQEANALPGWLETHLPYFDDVRVMHAGPRGACSDDGTLEILKKWNVPVEFCAIDEGFGVVRTKTLRMSKCDYIMLLDADERFYPIHREVFCGGVSTPHSEVDAILQQYDFRDLKVKVPNWESVGKLGANLRVEFGDVFDQGAHLREVLEQAPKLDVVAMIRRHWHDFSFRRPTQNWHVDSDWQMRLVRNVPGIYFDQGTRMHERLVGAYNVFRAMRRGPFVEHFHFPFKCMEMGQRSYDVAIYDALSEGRRPPTLEEFERRRIEGSSSFGMCDPGELDVDHV